MDNIFKIGNMVEYEEDFRHVLILDDNIKDYGIIIKLNEKQCFIFWFSNKKIIKYTKNFINKLKCFKIIEAKK